MAELEALGTPRNKKAYISRGIREPLFGVATGAMKPLAKKIGKDHALSMALYQTGNYDAAYLAGMIADPARMRPDDFEEWIRSAYCYMLSDYVVAVTLAETSFAQEVADRWLQSREALTASAGWSCYCWLLGTRPDGQFDKDKLREMLGRICESIRAQPDRVQYAMNEFIIAVGVSYLPLHEEAVQAAAAVGRLDIGRERIQGRMPSAAQAIAQAAEKGRLGFKRRSVRC